MPIQDDIDDANLSRIEREAQRQKRAAQQAPVVQYLGMDGATGQVRVISGSGAAPVRVVNHSNTQARPGDIKRGFASGFDRGNVRRSTEIIRPRKTNEGTVLRLVEVNRGTKIEYWIGGDRVEPEKILEVDTAIENILFFLIEKTAAGLDDWIFATKSKIVGTDYNHRIRVIRGNGQNWTTTDPKCGLLTYRGSGFWTSSVEKLGYSTTLSGVTSNTTGTPLFSNYIRQYGIVPPGSGTVFGGGSEIQWEVYATTTAGGSLTTTGTQTRNFNYSPSSNILRAGLNPSPTHSYSYSRTSSEYNDPVSNNLSWLEGYQTFQCSGPGRVIPIIGTQIHSRDTITESGNIAFNIFSLKLFQGNISVNTGNYSKTNNYSSSISFDGPQSVGKVIGEVCSQQYPSGRWMYVEVIAQPTVIPSSSFSTSSGEQNENYSVSSPLSPSVDGVYTYSKVENQSTTEIFTFEYARLYIENLGYLYSRSENGIPLKFYLNSSGTKEFNPFENGYYTTTYKKNNLINQAILDSQNVDFDNYETTELPFQIFQETVIGGIAQISNTPSSDTLQTVLAMPINLGQSDTMSTIGMLYFPPD